MHRPILATLALSIAARAQYTATYDPNNLPATTEQDQAGTNQCGTANNQTSMCQNLYVNSIQDFCVWGAQDPNSSIGNVEQIVVAYCTKAGRGTRLIPNGTLISAHFVETPDYVQITGNGNWVNVNIAPGDAGGELDPHGPDGMGNPHGGLVFSNVWTNNTNSLGEQIHEWTNYMSISEYCIRICKPGPNAAAWCQHIYDTVGCKWVMPGNYDDGFDSCKGDSGTPPGLYPQPDGSTSTFYQGDPATPDPHPAPSTSACQTFQSTQLFAATATPTTTVSTSGRGTSTGTSSHPSNTNGSSTGAATAAFGVPYRLIATVIGLVSGAALIF